MEIVEGEFETRTVRCQADCGQWYKRPQEKRTDVNLAVHLVSDSWCDLMDTVLLICADSDLVPAVEFLKYEHGRRIILVDPPRRHSDDLAKLADARLHLTSSDLNQSQLPNPVEFQNRRNKTKRLHAPPDWTSN